MRGSLQFLLFCTVLSRTCARMSEDDDHSFMLDYLTWMKGSAVKADSLHIYSFGYERSLPLASIPLTPDSKLKLNLQTSGMATPSKWSLVVVGQKYVDRFDEVMELVDRIHEETQGLPFAIFVETEKEIQIKNVTSHMTPALVHIPKRRSSKSFVTKMKCQVTSDTTHKVMISREVKVPSYKEICGGEKIRVHLGYNNDPGIFKVENNTLLHDPPQRGLKGQYSEMPQSWEVLVKFFPLYNIEPIWLNCELSWGWYDEEQGVWTGCMGKIESDEVDIVTPSNYACYLGRGTIATCAPGSYYLPHYWFSKYPEKRSPRWNLIHLVGPISWAFTFMVIASVSLFFFVSARIGASYFGLQTFSEEIILSPFRIPLLSSSSFGFSSNMVLLVWCVWGGFLLHILECNYLTVLLKPVYEEPIDTAEDIIEKGIKIIGYPGQESVVEALKKSPFPLTRALAELMYVTKSWEECDERIANEIMEEGTAITECSFLYGYELALGRWHRSKDKSQKPYTDYSSYMMNKKWWLEEEFSLHMMRFQQAGLVINEIPFEQKEYEGEEPLEALTMEHFYFPLIILVVGLLLSTLSFIAEIIIKRCQRNDQL